jgi:hypothetical protein
MVLRHHPIRELGAINVKFFKNAEGRMLEPLSSGDGKRTVSPISGQGPLLTRMRQGILATCHTR